MPASGNVNQDISPKTNWFTDNIDEASGDPELEELAFKSASYGSQLGLIETVLIELAESANLSTEATRKLDDLKKIQQRIGQLKETRQMSRETRARSAMAELKAYHPEVYERVKADL